MFEIGSSLRAARERQGLSYAQVERDTRIRPRYLRALEEEDFDVLPGHTYVKGFLREYADYLGLEGQQFVDEFSTRFPPEDAPETVAQMQPVARPRFRLSTLPFAAGGIILAVVLITIWLVGIGGGGHQASGPPPRHRVATTVSNPPPTPPPQPQLARLTLTAATGACWLDAHLGSQTGPTIQTGTLDTGQSAHMRGKRIWIRLGDPTVLTATLNGRPVTLPQTTPVNVLVTPAGVRTTT
jgi:transcriptional regulator with XRE-family HTH domain